MRLNPTTLALALTLAISLPLIGPVRNSVATEAVPVPTGMSKGKAESMAQVGVILPGDLPEAFTAGRPAPPKTLDEEEAAFYRCVGTQAPPLLVRHRGAAFVVGENIGTPAERTNRIGSVADVTKDTVAAANDQERMRSHAAAQCYKERLVTMIQRDLKTSPTEVKVDLVPATVRGAEEAWGWQFSYARAVEGEEILTNGFVIGSRVGRSLLSMTAMGGAELGELGAVLQLMAEPVARVRAAACRPLDDLQGGNPAGLLDC